LCEAFAGGLLFSNPMNAGWQKNIFRSVIFLLLACPTALGQKCPVIEINSANEFADQNIPHHFIAIVGGQNHPALTYSWSVSVPAIIQQNSAEPDEIDIDLKGFSQQPVIVTVEVGGLPEGCSNTASFSLKHKNDSPETKLDADGSTALPTYSVNCPVSVTEGTPIYFSANLSEDNSRPKPLYEWTVFPGSISKGQGSSVIKVETIGLGNQIIRARIKVSGGDKSNTLSCSTQIKAPPYAYKLYEYSVSSSFEEKRARLRKFYLRLRAGLDEHAYIIVHGKKGSETGEAKAEGNLAEKYLVDDSGIESSRVVVIVGRMRKEPIVELWVVQVGAFPDK
jgi:hypothetical protein